jgi:hypothetical protein
MPITTVCPKCNHRGQVPGTYVGNSVACPKCGVSFEVTLPLELDQDAAQEQVVHLLGRQLKVLETIRLYVGWMLAIIILPVILWAIATIITLTAANVVRR